MSNACPSPQQLVSYAQGECDDFTSQTIAQHVADCKQCSTVVESLTKAGSTPAAPAPPAAPSPPVPTPTAAQTPLPTPVASPAAKTSILPWAITGIVVLAGLGTVGVNQGWFGGGNQPNQDGDADEAEVVDAPIVSAPGSNAAARQEVKREGFKMGDFNPTDAIEKIRVTVHVGENGSALQEGVDMQLGFGFPLRLFPVGTDAREPSFAAFPQEASLAPGTNVVNPGETAWFEFTVIPENPGLDELRATPALLSDLKVSDIHSIGFASRGSSDWVLAGYKIEVNDKLYASNDSVDVRAGNIREANQAEVESLLPPFQVLAKEVADLEAYVKTGFATDKDKQDLEAKKQLLKDSEGPLSDVAGKVSGNYPWFHETDAAFKPAAEKGPLVKQLMVTLVTGSDDKPGTMNPVYLYAGGQKHLLTSEVDYLVDEPGQQRFVFAAADLAESPIASAALADLGVGVVGNDRRFDQIPDRAKLQRVIVEADDNVVYDSEDKALDRRTLGSIWLIPPAHRDNLGNATENQQTDFLVHLWKPGMTVASQVATANTQAGGANAAIKVPPTLEEEPEPPVKEKNPFVEEQLALDKAKLELEKDRLQLEKDKLELERQKLLQQLAGGNNPFGGSKRPPINPGIQIYYIPVLPPPTVPPPINPIPPVTQDPTITNVRIAGPTLLQNGEAPVVTWDVLGDDSKITGYTVGLRAIAPHLSFLPLNLVASRASVPGWFNVGSVRSMQLSPINLTQSGISSTEQHHLFVWAEVTANYTTSPSPGTLIATSTKNKSNLCPIVPRYGAGVLPTLRLGPDSSQAFNLANVANGIFGSRAPGYQVSGDGFGFYAAAATYPATDIWMPLTLANPRPNPPLGDQVWPLTANPVEDCHTFKFEPFANNLGVTTWGPGPAAPVGHPNNPSKHITIRYDALVNLSSWTTQNFCFVAHAGFINAAFPLTNNNAVADIHARVVVRDVTSGVGTGRIASPMRPASALDANELIRVSPQNAFTLTWNQSSPPPPLQLIEIPIYFGKDVTQYQNACSSHPLYGASTPVNDLEFNTAKGPAGPIPLMAGNAANNVGTTLGAGLVAPNQAYVSVTLMIDQKSVNGGEGVGIFGARLASLPP